MIYVIFRKNSFLKTVFEYNHFIIHQHNNKIKKQVFQKILNTNYFNASFYYQERPYFKWYIIWLSYF